MSDPSVLGTTPAAAADPPSFPGAAASPFSPARVLAADSVAINPGAMLIDTVVTQTVAVVGARKGMTVSVTPETYPGDNLTWHGYVSADDVVTVTLVANKAATPTSSIYHVRVFA